MVTALFVGRFQPFHKGHEHTIKSLLKRFDKVIIAVGSTNKTGSDNPFSFAQRKRMIDAVLKRYKKRYRIIEVPDFRSDRQWARYVTRKVRFDTVVTRNAWTSGCFSGHDIIRQEPFRPKTYNATRIRKLIANGRDWEKYVPKPVVAVIKQSFV